MALTTYLDAIREGIWEEMERDDSVYILGEDVGIYGGAFKVTKGMLDHFGENRVVDTPISESAIVGAAIGSALVGMRPVAEMQFIDFISCAFDQIVRPLPFDMNACTLLTSPQKYRITSMECGCSARMWNHGDDSFGLSIHIRKLMI